MFEKKVEVNKPMRIVVVSDWHIGHMGCREDIIKDILNDLSKPDTYWIMIGDAVEGRQPAHKFYDANEQEMTVGQQYEKFFEYIRPYKDKCLGMVLGNHEYSLIQGTTVNPIQMFCNDNQITYAGTTLRLILENDSGKKISLMANHGAGGGSQAGGTLNKAIQYGKTFNADIVVLGHFHRLIHAEELKMVEDEEGRITWRPMTVVINGCTIEGYQMGSVGSYVERKCLAPVALGYAVINVDEKLGKTVELKSY